MTPNDCVSSYTTHLLLFPLSRGVYLYQLESELDSVACFDQ